MHVVRGGKCAGRTRSSATDLRAGSPGGMYGLGAEARSVAPACCSRTVAPQAASIVSNGKQRMIYVGIARPQMTLKAAVQGRAQRTLTAAGVSRQGQSRMCTACKCKRHGVTGGKCTHEQCHSLISHAGALQVMLSKHGLLVR